MADDARRIVGQAVKEMRQAKGLTQAALAQRMGVDRAYISGLELGQRNPTVLTLWHVAQALGVSVGPFFTEKRSGRSKP